VHDKVQGAVQGSCKHSTETLGIVKHGNISEQLGKYQLLKKASVPRLLLLLLLLLLLFIVIYFK
jgi:hypothetical protein